jgi:hypothetical protein
VRQLPGVQAGSSLVLVTANGVAETAYDVIAPMVTSLHFLVLRKEQEMIF